MHWQKQAPSAHHHDGRRHRRPCHHLPCVQPKLTSFVSPAGGRGWVAVPAQPVRRQRRCRRHGRERRRRAEAAAQVGALHTARQRVGKQQQRRAGRRRRWRWGRLWGRHSCGRRRCCHRPSLLRTRAVRLLRSRASGLVLPARQHQRLVVGGRGGGRLQQHARQLWQR